jgi:hypothetical protein
VNEPKFGELIAIRGDQRFVASLLKRYPDQIALMLVEEGDSPLTIWRWVQEHNGPRAGVLYFPPTDGTREAWDYWLSRCSLALETTDRRYARVVTRKGKIVRDQRAKIVRDGLAVTEPVE